MEKVRMTGFHHFEGESTWRIVDLLVDSRYKPIVNVLNSPGLGGFSPNFWWRCAEISIPNFRPD